MDYPKNLKIGPMTYKVKFKDTVLIGKPLEEKSGIISFKDAVIELSTDQNEQNLRTTFFHEFVHGINQAIDANRLFFESLEDEECFTSLFAKMLTAVLNDNVKRIEWKGSAYKNEEVNKRITETRKNKSVS